MMEMVLLMVGLSGWGFLSEAGLLVCRGQGPDIATRYVGRPVNTHLQKSADGHFQNYYDDRVSSWASWIYKSAVVAALNARYRGEDQISRGQKKCKVNEKELEDE